MDSPISRDKLTAFFGKYKYAVLVVCIGLAFMLLPTAQQEKEELPESAAENSLDMASQLESILPLIHGVGKAKVLLTISEGEQTCYVYDEDSSGTGDSTSLRKSTVILSDSQRAEQGLVRQVIPPVYLGAVVVCQGGDNPSIKLAVVEAVANATGLGTDRITVLKMK